MNKSGKDLKMRGSWELKVVKSFAAAHFLREYQGSCERLHGHNYRIEATIESNKLDKVGFVTDFRELKGMLKTLLDRLDHQCLNEIEPFDQINPSAENIACWISEGLNRQLPDGIRVKKLAVWETEGCSAVFRPDYSDSSC